MKEDIKNVICVCSDCSKKVHEQWQKKNKNTKINIGDNIKVAFSDKGKTEHLWVKVFEVQNNGEENYIGRINNIPVLVRKYKYNKKVKVKRRDIEALYSPQSQQ